MNNVIDISSRRKKSIQELSIFCIEEISKNWEYYAKNNRLNDYFISNTPNWGQENINYLYDLNALSNIEQKIKLEPNICAPGFENVNSLGWVASFKMNEIILITPFMPAETYARAFLILLFLKLKREIAHQV